MTDTPERYSQEIEAINKSIISFNEYLNAKYSIPKINAQTMLTDQNCIQILHQNWDGFGFPNSEKRGVYFVFGREMTTDRNGVYIGKASFGSTIGRRLSSHLTGFRNCEQFIMKGYNSEVYVLEWIISIDLDAISAPFLAPALEEYLIAETRKQINLINGTGN